MLSSFRQSSISGTSSAVSRDPKESKVESSHKFQKKQSDGRRKSQQWTRAPSIGEQSPVCDQTEEMLKKVDLDLGQGCLYTKRDDISTEDGVRGDRQVYETYEEVEEEEEEEEGRNRDFSGVKKAVEEPLVEKGGGGMALEETAALASVGSTSSSDKPESDTLPPAPFRRSRCSEAIVPVIDGIRQFGITKGLISRAVVKFQSPPDPHPLVTCFHFPGTFLTHRYVLDMVRQRLRDIPPTASGRVNGIQFIDRNTCHGTHGMDNRWLVSLASGEAVRALVDGGLTLFNRHIVVKAYDDILEEEYKEFLAYDERKLYAARTKRQLSHKQTSELEGCNSETSNG